jgi:hypothetical protein
MCFSKYVSMPKMVMIVGFTTTYDVAYGIGATKRNVKNVAVFFQILRRKH